MGDRRARWGYPGRIAGIIAALATILCGGVSSPARGATGTAAAPAVLASSVAECYGVIARLSLLTSEHEPESQPGEVRGVRWRLELSGYPADRRIRADWPRSTPSPFAATGQTAPI